MVAGRSAGSLFHKKVTVEGADEDLSFNILIPLPTSPQGIVMYIIIIILSLLLGTVPVTDSPSHNTAQQPPVQQGNGIIVHAT